MTDLDTKVAHLETLLNAATVEHADLAEQHHELAQEHASLLIDCERYRRALARIADNLNGFWGWEAHYALHPERKDHRKDRPE